MPTFRETWNRLLSFFRKQPLDRDLDAEIAAHLEMAIEENLRLGLTPEEARRRALVRFGGVAQAREQQRRVRGLPWLDIVLQDARYTLRTLRRDLSFAVIAIVILAFGIGANVVVFSVVDTILLRPLPFRDPGQLVRISAVDPKAGESTMTYTVDATEEFSRRTRTFSEVTAYFAFSGNDNHKLLSNNELLPVTGLPVMSNFFHALGVEPLLGRDFTREESLKNSRPVVLLGYYFWKRQFHGEKSIVGQTITLDNGPASVVGVLPESFDFGAIFAPGTRIDIYTPVILDDIRDDGNTLALMGRLKPGVTLGQAQAEADVLFHDLPFSLKHPEYKPHYSAKLFDMKDYVSGKLRRSLILLWCAVGTILLIVCVNLSNLLLARSAARSKEFAMRSALGAGRGRIARQLLTESLILSGAGALLGLGLAYAVTAWLAHQGSIALPLLSSVRVDGTALAWTVLIAIAAGLLFGVTPALRMSSGNLQEVLKDSGAGAGLGRKHDRLRSILVVSEVALACVLLVGAGLLLRSFLHVLDIDLGFQPSQSAAIQIETNDNGDLAKRSATLPNILARIAALPGVEAAGMTDNLPMSRNRSWGIALPGHTRDEDYQGIFVYMITPGYLRSIGMRLIAGHDISWSDGPKSPHVVVLNEATARNLWPRQNPIGQIVMIGDAETRVVGVIADVRETSAEAPAGLQAYLPILQQGANPPLLVVRSKVPPAQMGATVLNTLREINPEQPLNEFRPIQGLVDHVVSPRRFFVLLVSLFAALGLVLASLGIYGVISYSVARQTQEIGIRMALGATQGRVQRGVLGRTLLLTLFGILAGAIASLAIGRLMASLLFGTRPTDPATFVMTALLLTVVAALAGYLPARRASRIDPMVALRN
jgi:predicted permease